MNLLALDTSSLSCSVALQLGSNISERYEEKAREHTRLLLPMISSLMKDAEIGFDELDAIVLGNGPGSFIGMRIAASVAQGLAFASGKKIVPVSSLAAIACQVFADSVDAEEVIVCQDAHMSEVYSGRFARGDDDLPIAMGKEVLHGQTVMPELDDNPAAVRLAAGYGWTRYPDLFAANQEKFTRFTDVLHPVARFLLPIGAAGVADGAAIEPEELMPAYLRNKVAEPSPGP